MKLRVGVVGLGDAWESRYRLALRSLADRFEVCAVCAEVAQRAEQVAQEFDAIPVDGYRALSARSDIDAVLMLSSQLYGSLPILAACDAGKAIFCGAALDLDPQRAHEIKQRVEASGVAFMAEFPRRHAPATHRLKELIATRLGAPCVLFCHLRRPADVPSADSREDEQSLALREIMEVVDWCRYVVGVEPTNVFGTRHMIAGSTASDYEMMSLDFSPVGAGGTGVMAQISCGQYLPLAWPEAIGFRPPSAMQVACENGVAFVDLPSTLIWFDDAGRHMESLDNERPVGEQLLTHFHRAVTSLVRRTADLEDAYRSLRIVLAARESARTAQRISLDV
ncbi:MAG: Gfo/Idh/MocA family oxidoreductase [Pirellulaceae bacterium]|nr:Gfo/Idh/MocA family oxidoreductase [Pirellulaceae bacterium]